VSILGLRNDTIRFALEEFRAKQTAEVLAQKLE
jgi:hypothetical protein